jgi:TonB-dependent starch-binding outer membrane protein SusC
MKKIGIFGRVRENPPLTKWIRMMKLTCLLLTIALVQVSAETYSQTKKLTLNLKDAPLAVLFEEIEKTSEFNFFYDSSGLDLSRKVTVTVEDSNIEAVLDMLFTGSDISYEIFDRYIILKSKARESMRERFFAQQRIVSGKVTDFSGQSLPGATVVVKGTTQGTVTNADGNYSLSNIPEDATLVFSFVGMRTQEVVVGNQTSINISMVEEMIGLEEVVAVGYGTTRKSEITGSVGIVTSEELLRQPSINPLQGLAGKIPGVTVFSNSGQPSGRNRIIIRGMGTINASSEPLYVVDGVQAININDLNPNDITSIEVLKDASSAAIYGARGSNGVVLITTKRGLKEEGISIEYSSYVSAGCLAKKRNDMYGPMNSAEFMEVQKIAYENAPYFRNYQTGNEPKLKLDNDLLFDSGGNPRYDTDWEKEVTRTAFSHNHQFNIMYGTKKTSTGIFVNYTDQNGIFLNSYMQRANARMTFDVTPREWIKFGGNINIRRIWENRIEAESNRVSSITRAIYEFPSIFPVKWPDGTWSNSSQTQGTSLAFEAASNPVSSLTDNEWLHDRYNINGNFYINLQLASNIDFRTQFGFDNILNQTRTYYPTYLLNWGYPNGIATITNSAQTFWQNENYLTYEKKIGSNSIKAVAGASWQQLLSNSSNLGAYGFKNDFFKYNYVNVAENSNPPRSDYYDWAMNSYFFRGNYSFDSKYSLTLTGRYDGSSRFGKDNKYAFFPSAGISWLVSDEDFLSGIEFIDWLRLRASYGVTGNTEIGLYNSMATISSGTTLIGGSLASTSFPARIANPGLKWEKSYQSNFGLEIRAFDDVLSMEIEYYRKLTTDLLLERPIPSTTGFTKIRDNIGEISNNGFDIKIKTRNIKTSKFEWTTSFSVNYNKNTVEKLGENDEDIFPGPNFVSGSNTILRVGEPVSSFWGFVREGIYSEDEVEEAAKIGKKPGMIKRSIDRKIIGKGLPDYVGSLVNQFSLGNFDATIDFQFSYGADILQQFLAVAEDRFAMMSGMKTELYNSWTPENQNTMIPMIRHTSLSGQDLAVDSHWVCDGSYLRANLFSIGYTFNKSILDKIGINHLRLNASLQNAFVITSKDFKGYDPESDSHWSNSNFGQNIFLYEYPKPRTLTLGLNARF